MLLSLKKICYIKGVNKLSNMETITTTLLHLAGQMGYLGIVLLMTIESSFVPFPSEIVIPPAAFLAARGIFNVWLVVFSGIIGSLLGAIINYFLAKTLGRKIIYSLARANITSLLLINEKKIEKAEKYFLKRGNISTFLGRLLPGIRQLISIPAGFSQMNFKNFCFFTFLGSSLWVSVLALLGYFLGANMLLLKKYYIFIKISFVFSVGALIIYLWLKNKAKQIENEKCDPPRNLRV